MPENRPDDYEIFGYAMFSSTPSPDGPEEGERMIVKAAFSPGNYQKFRMEFVKTTNPLGIKVYAYGDDPPNMPNEAIISYLLKETMSKGHPPIYALGEIMFSCCLDYADRYYVKMPFQPDSEHNSRFWIQPCSGGGERHWHVIELDDVTKQPANLLRDMLNHDIPTLGAAFEYIAGDFFKDMTSHANENPVDRIVRKLMGMSEIPSLEEVQEPGKDPKPEEEEERTTPTDILNRMWNTPSGKNEPSRDDE